MSEAETRLQRDNWEAVARAIDALPGVHATTSHEARAQSLEHAHYWDTHWIVSKVSAEDRQTGDLGARALELPSSRGPYSCRWCGLGHVAREHET